MESFLLEISAREEAEVQRKKRLKGRRGGESGDEDKGGEGREGEEKDGDGRKGGGGQGKKKGRNKKGMRGVMLCAWYIVCFTVCYKFGAAPDC